jgi:hypothetical protein
VLDDRINFGPGYRVYFGRDGDVLMILLTGGTKKRQQRDIVAAIEMWADYRTRQARDQMSGGSMALTRSFKELVQRHVAADPAYGEALLREGIDTMLAGDIDTGKTILRDYIEARIGFEKLGEATATQPKSLIRMFGPRGNPAGAQFCGSGIRASSARPEPDLSVLRLLRRPPPPLAVFGPA